MLSLLGTGRTNLYVLGVRRRGAVVNTATKRAARLAIYLECAGLRPAVQGATYREYCASLKKPAGLQ